MPVVIQSILQLDQKVDENDQVRVTDKSYHQSEIVREFFTKQALFSFVSELCETFGKVEVIEQYGNYMRLRVEKLDKKIGFLFKLIEEMLERHENILEYSAHQMTLEQIFQGFANLSFNEKFLTYKLDAERELT